MSGAGLLVRQVKFENRSFWRNPAAAFFTFAFPLMFLVIFNGIFGGNQTVDQGSGTISMSTFYVASIAAFSVITACLTNIAISVSFARDEGVLKRVRGTPLPAWAYLGGRIVHSTLIAVLLVGIVTLAGALFYDVSVPGTTMPAFVVTVIIGAAVFSAMGLALTALVPNADAAPAVVNASVLPLLFVSEIFIPMDKAPDWMVTLGKIFPYRHYSDAMEKAFSPFTTGSGFAWDELAIVGVWGVVGIVLAMFFFRWEPSK